MIQMQLKEPRFTHFYGCITITKALQCAFSNVWNAFACSWLWRFLLKNTYFFFVWCCCYCYGCCCCWSLFSFYFVSFIIHSNFFNTHTQENKERVVYEKRTKRYEFIFFLFFFCEMQLPALFAISSTDFGILVFFFDCLFVCTAFFVFFFSSLFFPILLRQLIVYTICCIISSLRGLVLDENKKEK